MNLNRILILAVFDLKKSVFRLKGLLFLIPFFLFWYWVLEYLYKNGGETLVTPQSIALLSILYKPEIAQILLVLHPPTLSVFLIMTLATLPFFVFLAGNDQLATDSGNQTFRYFLCRCSRQEIFTGRFISSYTMVACSVCIIAAITTLISIQNDPYQVTDIIEYAIHVTFISLVFLVPMVAYMTAVSAMMSSGLSTILTGSIIYFVLLLSGSYLTVKTGADISLVPGGIKNYLFDINEGDLYFAVFMLLIYTCIYSSVGWLIFKRRNI